MSQLLKRFVREEDGATMVEYGLMVALIAVICIGTVAYIGAALNFKFWQVGDAVNNGGTVDTANPGQPGGGGSDPS